MTPLSIDGLVQEMKDLDASDLHLTVGSKPVVRRRGELEALEHHEVLTGEDDARPALPDPLDRAAEGARDAAPHRHGVLDPRRRPPARQRLLPARDARRRLPHDPDRHQVARASSACPQHIELLADKPRGLVLVTGPTGSGKSTTLASLIDHINSTRSEHILTIEDPIEFLHHHRMCIVNQREIGFDTPSFAEALRAALRQDPDVILVGEMRDLETIATALTAAETGHLVFATLHTQSAPQTIDRVIDVFPAEQQDQVRIQLAGTLQGIVTQNLVPTADHLGRVAALEILLPDDAVRNLIRQGKVEQIYSVMQTGTSRGMQTMEQSLADLLLRGVITREAAFSRTTQARAARRADRARRHPQSHRSRWPEPGSSSRGCEPMVDLHKELKLSDLIPKLSGGASRSRSRPRRRSGGRCPPELVGLKIEAGRPDRRPCRQQRRQEARCASRSRRSPPGVVGGGEVRDPAGLATALNEFFATNDLPRRGVRLGLANTRIGVRVIEIAGVADLPQLENAIGFRAHEILSVPLDEAVLDYHVLGPRPARTARRPTASCSSSPTATRSTATSPRPTRPSIEVAGIDLDAFALLRALAPHPRQPRTTPGPAAVAAVAIDHDLTTLAISDGVTCQFTRVLEWGTANVDLALCRALKVTGGAGRRAPRAASRSSHGRARTGAGRGMAPQPADVVRRELQTLVRELVSSIRFYGSQDGRRPGPRPRRLRARSSTCPGFAAPARRRSRRARDRRRSVRPGRARPRGRAARRPRPASLVAVGLGIED